jgi:chorismate mutase
MKPSRIAHSTLGILREQIDLIDFAIIGLIARRLAVAGKIGTLKKKLNIKIKDLKRERKVQKLHKKWSKKQRMDFATVEKIFKLIMVESQRIQKSMSGKKHH